MVMFCENFTVKKCFIFWGLSHVLKLLSHAGATMQQLDTPDILVGLSLRRNIYRFVNRQNYYRYATWIRFKNE